MDNSQITAKAEPGPRAAAQRQPGFRLLRYFSVASFAAIAIATGLLATLYERQALRNLLVAQEYHHVALLRLVSNVLWPKFPSFMAESAQLDKDALKAHAEMPRIHQVLQADLAGTRVLRIRIVDLAGRTIFSTVAAQIGDDQSKGERFLAARAGQIVTDLARRDRVDAIGQTLRDIEVVSSYVPVRKNGSGEVEAVFEVDSDISSLMERVRETRNTLIVEITPLLLALYLALLLIVRHADVIERQTARHEADVEALHRARNELANSEQFHRALIEHASDTVVVLDASFKVTHAATTVKDSIGRSSSDMTGTALADYARPEYRGPLSVWLTTVAARPGTAKPFEFEGQHPEKGQRLFVANATNLLSDPAVHGIVVNIRDNTDRKRAEMQARRLALYDGLTGLARRDFFAEQARRAIDYATRYEEHLAILFLDLDGFKRINDTRGHHVGDALLKAVADRMRETMRGGDTIGRYLIQAEDHVSRFGGDEFMILLRRLQQPADAATAALRLLDALARPYTMPDGAQETITASIGIAIFPQDGHDLEELMKRADAAMYSAKTVGKNTYKLASEA